LKSSFESAQVPDFPQYYHFETAKSPEPSSILPSIMAENIQKVTVSHSSLGTITGRRVRQNVLQFRSIPFATIPARFRQSLLSTELGAERDFTEFGYACPARHQDADWNGGPLKNETPRKYDEFKCLNLTISTPMECMSNEGAKEKLPVMVYCHGGGFVEGAGNISYRQGE
jgi:carboxylesterase type B